MTLIVQPVWRLRTIYPVEEGSREGWVERGGGIPDQRFAVRTRGARAGGKRRESSGYAGGRAVDPRCGVAPEAAMLAVRDQ